MVRVPCTVGAFFSSNSTTSTHVQRRPCKLYAKQQLCRGALAAHFAPSVKPSFWDHKNGCYRPQALPLGVPDDAGCFVPGGTNSRPPKFWFDEEWAVNGWYRADHAAGANCELRSCDIDGAKCVGLFTKRVVHPSEELCHQYTDPDPKWGKQAEFDATPVAFTTKS